MPDSKEGIEAIFAAGQVSQRPVSVYKDDWQEIIFAHKDVMPHGIGAEIERQQPAPFRNKGSSYVSDIPSFLAHNDNHNVGTTEIFCSSGHPSTFTALSVYNSPKQGQTGWSDFKCYLQVPQTIEFSAWGKINGTVLKQTSLCSFLEEHIETVDAEISEEHAKLAGSMGYKIGKRVELLAALRNVSLSRSRDMRANIGADGSIDFSKNESVEAVTKVKAKMPSAFFVTMGIFETNEESPVFYRFLVRLILDTSEDIPHFKVVVQNMNKKLREETGRLIQVISNGVPSETKVYAAPDQSSRI